MCRHFSEPIRRPPFGSISTAVLRVSCGLEARQHLPTCLEARQGLSFHSGSLPEASYTVHRTQRIGPGICAHIGGQGVFLCSGLVVVYCCTGILPGGASTCYLPGTRYYRRLKLYHVPVLLINDVNRMGILYDDTRDRVCTSQREVRAIEPMYS